MFFGRTVRLVMTHEAVLKDLRSDKSMRFKDDFKKVSGDEKGRAYLPLKR